METMKYFMFLVFGAFCVSSGGSSGVIPTKVNEMLDKIFSKGITIPNIALGNENKASDIIVLVSKDSSKAVSGKDWGLNMKGTIPQLNINGSYSLKNLDIPGLFPLYGNGKFMINFSGLSFNFVVEATSEKDVDVKNLMLDLETSKVSFENLFNDQSVADFVCEILSNTLPFLVKSIFGEDSFIIFLINPLYENFLKCLIPAPTKFEECLKNITHTFDFKEFAKNVTNLAKKQLNKY